MAAKGSVWYIWGPSLVVIIVVVVVGTLVSAGFAAVVLVGVVATVVSCAVSPQALSTKTNDSNMTKQKNKGKILCFLDISYSFGSNFSA